MIYPPSAATLRFDGGHPALEFVNTVYGPADGRVSYDVLATPADLVTFAERLGFADAGSPASERALTNARDLRQSVDRLLRAQVAGQPRGAAQARQLRDAVSVMEHALRAALGAAHMALAGGALAWRWDAKDPFTPVHRLARAAGELLADAAELDRLHQCDGCRWLFLDHSRGPTRRWCSMADCGTEAKKRRYVQRRRALRQDQAHA